ncbi:MAG: hypothetical protein BGO98_34915 [Myxococcales bacterium 68-20]|nr:MAG: hypothetical protein BGO98_34915 [Myxococcales bacterium 68-20]
MSISTGVEAIGEGAFVREDVRTRSWLERVVHRRMNRARAKARAKREAGAYAGLAPEERARSVVRWACAKTAVTGGISGAATTGATVATAETKGLAAVVALPFAAAAIGGEMAMRAVCHVDLACELAEIFEVNLEGAEDVLLLLALEPGGPRDVDHEDLGQALVHRAAVESDALFARAANVILGESVLRNLLPFAGVLSSAVTNVVVTRRLGHTLRRFFRYERAMVDAFRAAEATCAPCMDLLIEGLWYVFIADGRMSLEETACLTQRLGDLDEERRRQLLKRLGSDESDWLERLQSVPEGARDAFLRVLETAAAVDKTLMLPEAKILQRVARVFGRTFDPQRVGHMIDQLEENGVLA